MQLLKKQSSTTIEVLKWVAISAMLIDHIGAYIFDNLFAMRAIGRMAMPLFSYILVHNYIFFSRDKTEYIMRLFLLALVSQPVYLVMSGHTSLHLNILFLLSLTLFVILYLERIAKMKVGIKTKLILGAAIILLGLIASVFTDYNSKGYVFILLLYASFKNPMFLFLAAIVGVLLQINNDWVLGSLLGFFSTILLYYFIVYVQDEYSVKVNRVNKYFFYLFYPLHITVIILCMYLVILFA